MMQYIVINRCYGGFSLSRKAFLLLRQWGNKYALEEEDIGENYGSFCRSIPRNNKDLIEIVTLLGKEANGSHADLKIVTIPDGVEWEIEEYDGLEHVVEKHRTWY